MRMGFLLTSYILSQIVTADFDAQYIFQYWYQVYKQRVYVNQDLLFQIWFKFLANHVLHG